MKVANDRRPSSMRAFIDSRPPCASLRARPRARSAPHRLPLATIATIAVPHCPSPLPLLAL